MSPTLNGSSALQHFEYSNAVKIRNRIMFDFYLGLPHIHVNILEEWVFSVHTRISYFAQTPRIGMSWGAMKITTYSSYSHNYVLHQCLSYKLQAYGIWCQMLTVSSCK